MPWGKCYSRGLEVSLLSAKLEIQTNKLDLTWFLKDFLSIILKESLLKIVKDSGL